MKPGLLCTCPHGDVGGSGPCVCSICEDKVGGACLNRGENKVGRCWWMDDSKTTGVQPLRGRCGVNEVVVVMFGF